MRKLIDLHPVLELITDKLNTDRQDLRRILEARNVEELRDFDQQDRLLGKFTRASAPSIFLRVISILTATRQACATPCFPRSRG